MGALANNHLRDATAQAEGIVADIYRIFFAIYIVSSGNVDNAFHIMRQTGVATVTQDDGTASLVDSSGGSNSATTHCNIYINLSIAVSRHCSDGQQHA